MPDGQVIEFARVTKRFGSVPAVSDFSARIEPGRVTGFLGPNGAGKTTTLRLLLGLVRPTSGTATIGGKAYRDLDYPLQTVGAALEASSFHPGRSGANHLKICAQAGRIPIRRVDEVLALVGLTQAAGRKVGGYSLGMRQRLGIATALLGDPGVLILDEPTNGLDPEGIRWVRTFLRQLAREGRTILASSHLLAEVQQTAQALVIISHGRLVYQGGVAELAASDGQSVVVDSPDRATLVAALRQAGVQFEVMRSGLTVRAADTTEIGAIAAQSGVALSTLQRRRPALEEIFLELVSGMRAHPSAAGIAGTLAAGAGPEDAAGDGAPGIVDGDSTAHDEKHAHINATQDEPHSEVPGHDSGNETSPIAETDRPLPGSADLAAAVAGLATADESDRSDAPVGGDDDLADDLGGQFVPGDGYSPVSSVAVWEAGTPEASLQQESDVEAEAHGVFHVASTGVIDIVPGGDDPAATPEEHQNGQEEEEQR